MSKIYECDPAALTQQTAAALKSVEAIKAPEWAPFVKTGMHKEKPPMDKDWWYTRAASVLRRIHKHGPIGVSKLRSKYGGKKNNGVKMEHTYKGSGNIIRKILQQLEQAGFVKQGALGVHKGRILTAPGAKFLNQAASKITPKQVPKPAPKPEAKPAPKAPAEEKKEEAKPAPEAKVESKPKPVSEAKKEPSKSQPESKEAPKAPAEEKKEEAKVAPEQKEESKSQPESKEAPKAPTGQKKEEQKESAPEVKA